MLSRVSKSLLLQKNIINRSKWFSTRAALKESVILNSKKFATGSVYHGFICTDIQEIKEFNMTAVMFRHERSKTEYLHLQRDDSNNVFSANFRTTPFNSTGLPHILEHTVLCGSKIYPVRDPFFKMLNRSLATFMNAMTGADFTMYPFSSQNEADYRNLQKIYLDAVFQPNLNYLDFLQEGWRLEYSDLKNKKSDLKFKGVVFNEMKGVFSENSAIFAEKFLNTILPDHTYGYVSGGDPLEIPNLTVEDLRNFHSKYYHPSNCKLYSYGNFPVERNLKICDELYLKNYEAIDSLYSVVPPQSRWKNPVKKNIDCRYDKMGAPLEIQNQIAIGYLMCDIKDIYETFVLQVLSRLMVTGPNSAFYKSLIEPNISGGYNALTGFDANMRDTLFVIGLQDLEKDKFVQVEEIVDHTIHKIIKEGFDKTHVDSVLHGIELGIKHQSTRFGLNTLFNLVPLWNHGGSVMKALQVEKFLSEFKKNIKNPKYLTERLEHYFVSNNHKLTMSMIPNEAFEENIRKMENDLLEDKISKLTEKEKNNILDEGIKLAESQKSVQNLDVLPCLTVNDIPVEIEQVTLERKIMNNVSTHICRANTNNVTYYRAILDTTKLSEDLLLLVPFFNSVVTEMDTNNYDYRKLDQLINLKTGGLSFSTHIVNHVNVIDKYEQGILLSSHCLDSNITDMMKIWKEIFDKPRFKDIDRFKMLFDNYVSNLTGNIASSGHHYAMSGASGLVTSSGSLRENLGGLKHVNFFKDLKNCSIEEIMNKISSISNHVLNKNNMRMAINMSKGKDEEFISVFDQFTKDLPTSGINSEKINLSDNLLYTGQKKCIHYLNNFSVNYCSKAIYTVPFIHKDFAKLLVLAKFLSSKYLHPIVREQNGAYGSGANISDEGIFTFFSYRDPNCKVTLDVFDNTENWFNESYKNILTDQTLFEAKLGVLQKLDSPIAEGNKGMYEFLSSLNNQLLQEHRNSILSVSKEDLMAVCNKYLNIESSSAVGKCVIGPGEKSGEKIVKNGEEWDVVDFEG